MDDNTNIVAPQLFASRDIREDIIIDKDDGSIEISTDVSPVYSYVLYVNKTHLVRTITTDVLSSIWVSMAIQQRSISRM